MKYSIAFRLNQLPKPYFSPCNLAIGNLQLNGSGLVISVDVSYQGSDDDLAAISSTTNEVMKLCYALGIHYGVPLMPGSPEIKSKTPDSGTSGPTQQYLTQAAVTAEAGVCAPLTQGALPGIQPVVTKLDNTNPDDYECLESVYRWWVKAHFDDNELDRFIGFFVCCEILAGHYYGKPISGGICRRKRRLGLTNRVKRLLSQHTKEVGGSKNIKQIIRARGDMLHSGIEVKQAAGYNTGLDLVVKAEMKKLASI